MNINSYDLLGDLPLKEESIDDLLGAVPLSVPKTRSLNVPVATGPLIAFRTRLKKELIVGNGTKMWVVTDNKGKLHYTEQDKAIVLPEDWKDGDFVPKFD